jgi:hypothetical protein
MLVRCKPLGVESFPERTKPRRAPTFSVNWNKCLTDLERELEFLGAKDVVIQIDLTDDDFRIDGWPKAGRNPTHPGVIISFDSKFGPLRYFCDEYDRTWSRGLSGYQANVRAISLGLEALRAVDRYGITKKGEQYTGWKQLGQGDGPTTREEAAALLTGLTGITTDDILLNAHVCVQAIREALRITHPDNGGKTEDFHLVARARAILEGAR